MSPWMLVSRPYCMIAAENTTSTIPISPCGMYETFLGDSFSFAFWYTTVLLNSPPWSVFFEEITWIPAVVLLENANSVPVVFLASMLSQYAAALSAFSATVWLECYNSLGKEQIIILQLCRVMSLRVKDEARICRIPRDDSVDSIRVPIIK